MTISLAVNIAGLSLQNPVMTASGTAGFGEEYALFTDVTALGALVVKTVTIHPRDGNPPPRIAETPAGIVNAVGLQNPGIAHFISEVIPRLRHYGIPVVVSIAGDTIEEYAYLAEELANKGGEAVTALEVNISCPNVKKGGLAFGCDPDSAARVVSAVKANINLPVIVKLTPNVTDITQIAVAAEAAGADALSLINTLSGMVIDIHAQKPLLGNQVGGLSGPAVRPVAVRAVWQVYRHTKLPLIGMGGIQTAADAVEFLLAGASAVAVGTGSFVDPQAAKKVVSGIHAYLLKNKIADVKNITGAAHRGREMDNANSP